VASIGYTRRQARRFIVLFRHDTSLPSFLRNEPKLGAKPTIHDMDRDTARTWSVHGRIVALEGPSPVAGLVGRGYGRMDGRNWRCGQGESRECAVRADAPQRGSRPGDRADNSSRAIHPLAPRHSMRTNSTPAAWVCQEQTKSPVIDHSRRQGRSGGSRCRGSPVWWVMRHSYFGVLRRCLRHFHAHRFDKDRRRVARRAQY
jgi:hypothetical protein